MREVTYNELRELAYMGASVLHDEAVFPVREVSIPINIRNTNAPENTGTLIVPSRPENDIPVVGIAGRRGFSTIYIEKVLMNQERGFGRRMLGALESHGVSYEHTPSGIDSMSIIVQDEELEGKEDAVLSEITRVLQPDRVELLPGLALIATVGQGMSHRVGVASRLFRSLSEAAVNVRMINQGASEINILVGVASDDYERAVRAIYREFVPDPMP
jgi:aspartate kinase